MVTLYYSRQALGRTITKTATEQFSNAQARMADGLKSAVSKILITFDLWSDRACRRYLPITAHYIDYGYNLRSPPLLSLKFIDKSSEGYTRSRIHSEGSASLAENLGTDWRDKFQ